MISGYVNPSPVELKRVFDISDYKRSFISFVKKGLLLIHALRLRLRQSEVKCFCCVPDKLHKLEKIIYISPFLKHIIYKSEESPVFS